MNRAIVSLAAFAALSATAWFALRGAGAHRAAPPAAHPMAVPAGEASPASPADRIPEASLVGGPRIPVDLPPFTLTALDGRPTPIARFAGRSLILNFWATWCGPCRREIPLLESVAKTPADHDLQVVGVAVDHRSAVVEYARRIGISYPLLVGEDDALAVAASLGVADPAFPFTVFTDAHRRIVAVYLGELQHPELQLILGVVRRVNAGTLDLAAARTEIRRGLEHLEAA